jgi:hypothetical protein
MEILATPSYEFVGWLPPVNAKAELFKDTLTEFA